MTVLKKNPDRDFVILNLTDTQLSDAEWAPDHHACRILTDTVDALVEKTKPDLITLSGDLAWGTHYESYTKLRDYLDTFDIPWAPVIGNHDQEAAPEEIVKAMDILCESPNCLLEKGDPALGYGNYAVGIEEEGRLIHALIFMDSHNVKERIGDDGKPYLAWAELWPNQFDWYRETVASLCEKETVESTLILHIPFYTYQDALGAAMAKGVDFASLTPEMSGMGAPCWNEGYKDSFGLMYEGICSYPEDNGFFEVLLEMGSTKNVICGHDHVNTASVNYRGIRLTYGVHTGCGCYWNPVVNGGTTLTVASDGSARVEHHYFPYKGEQA